MRDSYGEEREWRLQGVSLLASILLLVSVLLSCALWTPFRSYPTAELSPFLVSVGEYFFGVFGVSLDGFFVILALFLLAAGAVLRWWPGGALGLLSAIFLVLLDQSRMQEWFLFSVAVLVLLSLRRRLSPEQIFAALQVVIIGVYFWAGIHKLNATFIYRSFPWMVDTVVERFPDSLGFLELTGVAVPFFEAGIAVLLLCRPPLRILGVIALTTMHLGILLLIGPFGHNYNSVVWPWNMAMIGVSWLLFCSREPTLLWKWSCWRSAPFLGAVCLYLLLPSLFLVRWIDSAWGLALYSGAKPTASILYRPESPLASEFHPFLREEPQRSDTLRELPLLDWSMTELNVPSYPAVRVYRAIFRKLCTRDESLRLRLTVPRSFFVKDHPSEVLSCDETVGDKSRSNTVS
ncbi:hypothetical protein MRY87_05825 [bacterium]|nr:hypothetical protein [bacterium]